MLIQQLDDYWEITKNINIRGGGFANTDVDSSARRNSASGNSDSEARGSRSARTSGALTLRVASSTTSALSRASARFTDSDGTRGYERDYSRDYRRR